MKTRKELDAIALAFAQGLPFDMRWGGYIATEALKRPDGSGALRVAATVLEAAVRHPEWAIAAVRELRASGNLHMYPTAEIEAEAERLVMLSFIERSQQ